MSPSPGGQGAGQRAGKVVEQELDATSKVKNAKEALRLLSDVDGLVGTATSFGMGSLRDQVYGFFGKSTAAGDAAGELQNVAAKLLAFADKSGLGPQFSDADRKFLESASSGGIGDPAVPESRKRATLARIRSNLEYAAGGTPPPSRSASGKVSNAPAGESVRDTLNKVTGTVIRTEDEYNALPPGTAYGEGRPWPRVPSPGLQRGIGL